MAGKLKIVNDKTITNVEQATAIYGNARFLFVDAVTTEGVRTGILYAVSSDESSYVELNRLAQEMIEKGEKVFKGGIYDSQLSLLG